MEPTEENVRAWEALHRRRDSPIPETVRERLPDLTGRHVLHLACGSGAESVELAENGAFVTAVDVSEDRLETARARSNAVAWVHGDVHELPLELHRGRFDLVYVRSLDVVRHPHAWAAGIAGALKPGGYLYAHAAHPVEACLDASLRWREDYFERPGVGDLVTAIARARLVVRRLEELQALVRPHDRRIPAELVLVAAKPRE
jgi:ubiquinone/menaquinone biosynthesis C-methylase UbiE